MKCKQCGSQIIEGGLLVDQAAQKRGFCSAGCEEAYEKLKEWNLGDFSMGVVA